MKNALIVTCALLFVSMAGFADGPAPGPVSDEVLSVILGEPLAGASCAAQVSAARGASMRRASVVQNEKTCTATVTCLDGTTRSCSSASTNCVAVNPSCPTTPGSVTCNGVTTSCPVCPCDDTPPCCRCERTGDCMSCCRCGGGTFSQCNQECNPF